VNKPKWYRTLQREQSFSDSYKNLSLLEWEFLIKSKRLTSTNYDTVVSLDWPHFCEGATVGCGGSNGWCYTFQGRLASERHINKVGLVDALAKANPELFAETVANEVMGLVKKGKLSYANLRYSGTGEVTYSHLPALKHISDLDVHLWGFTRVIEIARKLRELGASVIVSCDRTSEPRFITEAIDEGFGLVYTSLGVDDSPPLGTIVTFPLHKLGRVTEVVSSNTLCPKVAEEYIRGSRKPATCQERCHRCHQISATHLV